MPKSAARTAVIERSKGRWMPQRHTSLANTRFKNGRQAAQRDRASEPTRSIYELASWMVANGRVTMYGVKHILQDCSLIYTC